jgi:regulator of protease activity HflC (stomatin/prohibitin superfamily)
MKRIKAIIIVAFAMLTVAMMSSCTRIDAACEGIKVNLYGSDKGVDDVVLVTGMVWFNPFTEEVYEYPTYVQMVDYEPFEINAKDGSKFIVDPTININPITGKAATIFKKYRKPLNEVIHDVLKTHIVNAYRIKLNSYTTDELVSKREEFERVTEDYLREVLAKENFELGEMTSGLKYPATLEASITAKNQAVQEALRIENEVAAIEAEAKKRIAEANGEATALKIKADGEAYYNRTVSASLSNALVQMKALEKWDGKTPIISGGASTFIDAGKFIK